MIRYHYHFLAIVHQTVSLYINFYYCRTYEFFVKNDVPHVISLICFVNDICFLFTHTGVQHDFNITWYSCSLTVARRVSAETAYPFGEREFPSIVIWVRVTQSAVFCLKVCISLFELLYIFGHYIVCLLVSSSFFLSNWRFPCM